MREARRWRSVRVMFSCYASGSAPCGLPSAVVSAHPCAPARNAFIAEENGCKWAFSIAFN